MSENNANIRNEMFKKVCALIPNQVDNKLVVNAFEILRKEQKLLKKDFSANLKKNQESFKKHEETIKKNKGYVEDQNSYTDMAYGESTMQYSGCEIFATYNAMYNINGKVTKPLADLISSYEKDGMVLSGKFGTAPKAISDFLEKQGFVTKLTTEEKEFDDIGKKFESMILTMYNNKDDISQEVHTVNISKENGKFTAHNVYCNGKVVGPYASVSEVIKNINGGKAKGISLIGVKKK
jgi:ATP-binding cassette subfamily B protein